MSLSIQGSRETRIERDKDLEPTDLDPHLWDLSDHANVVGQASVADGICIVYLPTGTTVKAHQFCERYLPAVRVGS